MGSCLTLPKPRFLLFLVVIIVVLFAVLVAQGRYAAYNTEMNLAQDLDLHQQYALAIPHYEAAINDWPLGNAAKTSRDRDVSLLAAIQAQATASASAAVNSKSATAARASVNQSFQQLQQQAAAQIDSGASTAP